MQNLGWAWLAEREQQKNPCLLLFFAKSQLRYSDGNVLFCKSYKTLTEIRRLGVKKDSKFQLERKKVKEKEE